MADELYHVWWEDPDGNINEERRWLTDAEAVLLAKKMTERPATRVGIMKRIFITDGGDSIVFEWKYNQGVTFPTPEMRAAHRAEKQP